MTSLPRTRWRGRTTSQGVSMRRTQRRSRRSGPALATKRCCHAQAESARQWSDKAALDSWVPLPEGPALECEELLLDRQPAAITGQLAIRPDHTMAGDHDRQRVAAVGQTDGARR